MQQTFLKIIYLFIYLFLAVLGLRFLCEGFLQLWRAGATLHCGVAASLAAEHKLQTRRLSSCGSRAQLLRGMWDLPRPGLEPVSPALAGRLSTTVPPGKPKCNKLLIEVLKRFFLGTWKIDSKIYIKEQNVKNNQDAPQEDKYV